MWGNILTHIGVHHTFCNSPIDLNMGYYTIRLDPDASRICTVIFPWEKYSYKRLPMGIAGSPDIF